MNLKGPKIYALITGCILCVLGTVVGVPLLISDDDTLTVVGLIIVELGAAGFFMNITILLAECSCCDKKTGTWVAGVLWGMSLCIFPNMLILGLKSTGPSSEGDILVVFGALWGWVWFCCNVALITLHCCDNNYAVSDSPYPTVTMEIPSAPPLDNLQKKAMENYDIPVATPV